MTEYQSALLAQLHQALARQEQQMLTCRIIIVLLLALLVLAVALWRPWSRESWRRRQKG